MKLARPPEEYTEVRLISQANDDSGPWWVWACTQDLAWVQTSKVYYTRRRAWQLQQELQATCRAARRLLGLPTPLLNRP